MEQMIILPYLLVFFTEIITEILKKLSNFNFYQNGKYTIADEKGNIGFQIDNDITRFANSCISGNGTYNIIDENNNIVIKIENDGTIHFPQKQVQYMDSLTYCDNDMNIAFKIDKKGRLIAMLAKDTFVTAFNNYKEFLNISTKKDLNLVIPTLS